MPGFFCLGSTFIRDSGSGAFLRAALPVFFVFGFGTSSSSSCSEAGASSLGLLAVPPSAFALPTQRFVEFDPRVVVVRIGLPIVPRLWDWSLLRRCQDWGPPSQLLLSFRGRCFLLIGPVILVGAAFQSSLSLSSFSFLSDSSSIWHKVFSGITTSTFLGTGLVPVCHEGPAMGMGTGMVLDVELAFRPSFFFLVTGG